MRFKINYGGKSTYDPKDFSRGKFECKAVFQTQKGMPVVSPTAPIPPTITGRSSMTLPAWSLPSIRMRWIFAPDASSIRTVSPSRL